MNADIPVFTCAKCGKKHPSPGKNEGLGPDEEARKAWYAKADMLPNEEPFNEKLWVSTEKAGMKYLSSLNNGAWRFPDTMTTKNNSAVCIDCDAEVK